MDGWVNKPGDFDTSEKSWLCSYYQCFNHGHNLQLTLSENAQVNRFWNNHMDSLKGAHN